MSNGNNFSWQDIQDKEAQALKKGEFQGYVMEALKALDARLTRIETSSDQRSLVSMLIAGIVGGLAGIFGGQVR